MIDLLFALGALFLLAALHPFVSYPLSLMAIRLCRGRAALQTSSASGDRSIAICLCAFNEECIIEEKIRNLLDLRCAVPELEILAYVDGTADGTAERLRRHSGSIRLEVSRERRGKTYGMNHLAGMTDASLLIFTDANVMLEASTLARLRRYFDDPRVGCVCGNLICTNATESATAAAESLYRRLEEGIKQLETDTGSAIGADGALFAVRRRLRPEVPDDAADDIYISLSILCDGYRVVRAPDVRAYERALIKMPAEFQRKTRIACQAFNVHCLLWPRLRRLDALSLYKYLSHKLLRWFSPYTLALAAICLSAALAAANPVRFALGVVAVALAILLDGLVRGHGALPRLRAIIAAFVATAFGVWLSLRGEKFQTWTPARYGEQRIAACKGPGRELPAITLD